MKITQSEEKRGGGMNMVPEICGQKQMYKMHVIGV